MEEQVQPVQEENEGQQAEIVEQVRGFASNVSAEWVNFDSGFTFAANAGQSLSLSKSLAVAAVAGSNMAVSDSFVLSSVAGHDVQITDGVAGMLTTGGNAAITDGASVFTFSREVTAKKTGMGVVIANQVNLEEGSSVGVSMTVKHALAFGAAFGAVFALLSRLLRRK